MTFIETKYFRDIDLNDPFFDSLKNDYSGFKNWYNKKVQNSEVANVVYDEYGKLNAFLYLKVEEENHLNIIPHLPKKVRLKVGTFKILSRNTRLGEQFLKLIFERAIEESVEEIYVTIFDKHIPLINLFEKYNFYLHGIKGTEHVYIKKMVGAKHSEGIEPYDYYPRIYSRNKKKFLLGIHPIYHTKLFPEAQLKRGEQAFERIDTGVQNSIEKIYLCGMSGVMNMPVGSPVVIYRTKDEQRQSAYYSSVATSLCSVVTTCNIKKFSSFEAFKNFVKNESVFSDDELKRFWVTKRFPYIIKLLFHKEFDQKIIRKELLESCGISKEKYFGFFELSNEEFNCITSLGINSKNKYLF